MKRLQEDCKVYAANQNSKKASVCVGITPELMAKYAEEQAAQGIGNVTPSFGASALERLTSLKNNLVVTIQVAVNIFISRANRML